MNPMMPSNQFQNQFPTRQEIVKVTGENGARAYSMSANSSALLLDENNPLVWLVQTDGAGYKTVTPYNITPYKPKPEVDLSSIESRIKKLEEQLSDVKSNNTNFKQKKSNE